LSGAHGGRAGGDAATRRGRGTCSNYIDPLSFRRAGTNQAPLSYHGQDDFHAHLPALAAVVRGVLAAGLGGADPVSDRMAVAAAVSAGRDRGVGRVRFVACDSDAAGAPAALGVTGV